MYQHACLHRNAASNLKVVQPNCIKWPLVGQRPWCLWGSGACPHIKFLIFECFRCHLVHLCSRIKLWNEVNFTGVFSWDMGLSWNNWLKCWLCLSESFQLTGKVGTTEHVLWGWNSSDCFVPHQNVQPQSHLNWHHLESWCLEYTMIMVLYIPELSFILV